MKRTLTLLLASLLVVCSLAACGCTAKQAGREDQVGSTDRNDTVTPDDNNMLNGTDNGMTNDAHNSVPGNNSLPEQAGDVIDNGLHDVTDAVDDVGEAITGNDIGGVTYGEMLRNSRTRDTDGNLKDGENTVSRGR